MKKGKLAVRRVVEIQMKWSRRAHTPMSFHSFEESQSQHSHT